jgi:hypothetical protein
MTNLDRQMAEAAAMQAEWDKSFCRLRRQERLWNYRFYALLAAIAVSPVLLGKLLGF